MKERQRKRHSADGLLAFGKKARASGKRSVMCQVPLSVCSALSRCYSRQSSVCLSSDPSDRPVLFPTHGYSVAATHWVVRQRTRTVGNGKPALFRVCWVLVIFLVVLAYKHGLRLCVTRRKRPCSLLASFSLRRLLTSTLAVALLLGPLSFRAAALHYSFFGRRRSLLRCRFAPYKRSLSLKADQARHTEYATGPYTVLCLWRPCVLRGTT
jgi:hypothetical protein